MKYVKIPERLEGKLFVKNGVIYKGKIPIGKFKTHSEVLTKEDIKNWYGDRIISKFTTKFNLCEKFSSIYIEKFRLNFKYRGKGYAFQIIKRLKKSAKKPVLIWCEAEPLDERTNLNRLKRFYKKLGFFQFKNEKGWILMAMFLKQKNIKRYVHTNLKEER